MGGPIGFETCLGPQCPGKDPGLTTAAEYHLSTAVTCVLGNRPDWYQIGRELYKKPQVQSVTGHRAGYWGHGVDLLFSTLPPEHNSGHHTGQTGGGSERREDREVLASGLKRPHCGEVSGFSFRLLQPRLSGEETSNLEMQIGTNKQRPNQRLVSSDKEMEKEQPSNTEIA